MDHETLIRDLKIIFQVEIYSTLWGLVMKFIDKCGDIQCG